MPQNKRSHLIRLCLLYLTLTGFDLSSWFYVPSIQQGNHITTEQVAQIKKGMSIQDIKILLGTSILVQTFLNSAETDQRTTLLDTKEEVTQMEYVYFYKPGLEKPIQKRISLLFKDEKLAEYRVIEK